MDEKGIISQIDATKNQHVLKNAWIKTLWYVEYVAFLLHLSMILSPDLPCTTALEIKKIVFPPNNPSMIKTDYNSYKKPVNLICCIGMKRADEHFEGYVNKVLPFYTNPQTVHWCWVLLWSCLHLALVSVPQHAVPSPYLTQPQLLPSTPGNYGKNKSF